jgi:predicted  nucleic acid-binding Zn-ribbon protein
MIREDLEHEIKNGQEAEASAQLEFEASLKAAEKLVADLTVKKENLETEIARLGEEKSAEHETMNGNKADLKDEKDYRAKITPDCDWIIGAFTQRAQKRTAEMNGLTSAKEHLVTR